MRPPFPLSAVVHYVLVPPLQVCFSKESRKTPRDMLQREENTSGGARRDASCVIDSTLDVRTHPLLTHVISAGCPLVIHCRFIHIPSPAPLLHPPGYRPSARRGNDRSRSRSRDRGRGGGGGGRDRSRGRGRSYSRSRSPPPRRAGGRSRSASPRRYAGGGVRGGGSSGRSSAHSGMNRCLVVCPSLVLLPLMADMTQYLPTPHTLSAVPPSGIPSAFHARALPPNGRSESAPAPAPRTVRGAGRPHARAHLQAARRTCLARALPRVARMPRAPAHPSHVRMPHARALRQAARSLRARALRRVIVPKTRGRQRMRRQRRRQRQLRLRRRQRQLCLRRRRRPIRVVTTTRHRSACATCR